MGVMVLGHKPLFESLNADGPLFSPDALAWWQTAAGAPAAVLQHSSSGPTGSVTHPVLYSPDLSNAGGPLPTTTTGSGAATSGTGTSSSAFVINITWDSSVQSAPSGFTTAVQAAV